MPQSRLMGEIPTSNNFVKETAFSFACAYIPDTVYHLQTATLPGISASPVNVGTPLSPVLVPGDNVEWSPITITFMVDEELANYRKMHDWIVKLYTGRDTSDLTTLKSENFIQEDLGGGVTDATLTVRSNKQNTTLRVKFEELFPTSLSDLQFTTVSEDAEYLVATATMVYNTYTIDYLG